MGTRSTIALEFADGSVGQVYCHWDGYLEYNGKLLLENWSDPFKLRDLIDQGDLSTLGKEIGKQHAFTNPFPYGSTEANAYEEEHKDMCTFYGRDRGESGIQARYFADFETYKLQHQYEEFEYILRTDGKWYVKSYRTEYQELTPALFTETV